MNPKQFLRTAERHAESSHYFVKNEHRLFALRNLAKMFEISFCRQNTPHVAHDRLHNHACNLMLELFEGELNRLGIVEGQSNRELDKLVWYSSGTRNSQRGYSRSRFHQQRVRMAVIAALKFHDVFTFGVGPRQTDRGHGSFRPRANKSHLLHVGKS